MSRSRSDFEETWTRDGPRVRSYARRHVGTDDAQDVVAETFTIAWRRWPVVPEPALPWLLATARRVIQAHRRKVWRHQANLGSFTLLEAVAGHEDPTIDRISALDRLAALSADHREAILLVCWDGLASEQAADVLGISAPAFRKRLQRARTALGEDTSPTRLEPIQELS